MAASKEIRTPLHVTVPPALYQRVSAFCEDRLLSPAKVVERALIELLDRHAAEADVIPIKKEGTA